MDGDVCIGTFATATEPMWRDITSFTTKTANALYHYGIGQLTYSGAAKSSSDYSNNKNTIYLYANPKNITFSKDKYIQICIYSTGSFVECKISGDMMSMVYGLNCATNENYNTIPNDYQFYKFFTSYDINQSKYASGGSTSTIIDCSDLVLSATNLTVGCYESMFDDLELNNGSTSTNTMSGPQIKAMSLKDCSGVITDCCKNMFNGCTYLKSLTTSFLDWGDTPSNVPTANWISSTQEITFNCPSTLPEKKDASHMGKNGQRTATVSSDVYIFNVSESGGSWGGQCNDYYRTTAAPSVPDPTGATAFAGWYSEDGELVTLSELPAPSGVTTYYAEFTGSVTVPYTITFKAENGDVLQTKKCRPGHIPSYTGSTDISRAGYVPVWSPAIVAATGNAEYQVTYVEPNFFTIKNTGNADKSVTIRKGKGTTTQPEFTYRVYYANGTIKTTWTDITISNTNGTSITVPANGGKIQIYGDNATLGTGTGDYTKFTFAQSSSFEISGNILSLVSCKDGTNFDENFDMLDYCFYGLFSDNIGTSNATHPVVDAKKLELPSSTVSSYGYALMFSTCKGLTNAPQSLPATDLGTYCYFQMFYQCIALTSAPYSLPAESLPNYCYKEMFSTCSILEKAPDIYGTSYGTYSLQQMFENCSNLKQIRSYYDGTWGAQTNYWVRSASASTSAAYYCPRTTNRSWGTTTYYNKIPRDANNHWTVYSYNVTFVPVGGNWSDDTNENKQFTWRTDVSDIEGLLTSEAERVTGYYSDELCTSELDNAAIQTILTTQPSNDNTTYIYAKISATSSYALDWDANGGALSGDYTAAGDYEAGATITAPTATRAGYTYTWDPAFTGTMPAANTTYTAQWTQKSYKLNLTSGGNGTVTRNDNGDSETVKRYNETVTLTPSESTGYHFDSWSGNGAAYVSKNVFTVPDGEDNTTYNVQAVFAPNTNTAYTVKHYKQNLALNGYEEVTEDRQNLSGTTATATAAAAKSYTGFTAQSFEQGTIAADGSTVVSIYYNRDKYTVTVVKNENAYGTLSGESENIVTVTNVPYGTEITTGTGDNANKVTINGTQVTATKHADDAQYTYAFNGWTNGTETVTGALTVTANFTQTTKQYTLTVNAGANGNVKGGGIYNYGASAELTATPAEGYHFVSWSDGGAQTHSVIVTDITAEQTYTATFAPNATYYMLTISAGENGTVDTSVNGSKEEGTNVQISATANTFYQFDQWSDGNKDNPRTVTMNEDKTLNASFKLADVIELEDQHEVGAAWWTDYNNLRTTLGSTTVTVQYNRTMEANKWHVVALPFEFNLMQHKSHPFSRHIYEMKDATYTTDGYLDFNFIPMTTIMTPNKPYIFYSETPVNNVSFADVELNAVESYTGDDVKFAVTGGELMFRNTTYREKLNSAGDENKSIIYIYDNRLYYPKTNEIWMRAFRGYFKLDVDNIYYVTPRVRIITGGQVTTALEAAESGNGTEVRKYVESGILVIERNGVKYNAQGGRIE